MKARAGPGEAASRQPAWALPAKGKAVMGKGAGATSSVEQPKHFLEHRNIFLKCGVLRCRDGHARELCGCFSNPAHVSQGWDIGPASGPGAQLSPALVLEPLPGLSEQLSWSQAAASLIGDKHPSLCWVRAGKRSAFSPLSLLGPASISLQWSPEHKLEAFPAGKPSCCSLRALELLLPLLHLQQTLVCSPCPSSPPLPRSLCRLLSSLLSCPHPCQPPPAVGLRGCLRCPASPSPN